LFSTSRVEKGKGEGSGKGDRKKKGEGKKGRRGKNSSLTRFTSYSNLKRVKEGGRKRGGKWGRN